MLVLVKCCYFFTWVHPVENVGHLSAGGTVPQINASAMTEEAPCVDAARYKLFAAVTVLSTPGDSTQLGTGAAVPARFASPPLHVYAYRVSDNHCWQAGAAHGSNRWWRW
jgi:hypothetical protein